MMHLLGSAMAASQGRCCYNASIDAKRSRPAATKARFYDLFTLVGAVRLCSSISIATKAVCEPASLDVFHHQKIGETFPSTLRSRRCRVEWFDTREAGPPVSPDQLSS